MRKKLHATLLLLMMHSLLWAQGGSMADTMRSNGKIYVVIAVIAVIFIGMVLYLVRLDRKVTRLEKGQE
ncbi:MAG TPA: CcmD family protein [Chitinophagaceae bacterium]|jgi:CcmD family protein|nr:CcmD family protein [Chitinophagaceae bacterium]